MIDAALVVDATGRGSRMPTWLADLGYPRPADERMAIDVGYATRCYRMPPDALGGAYGVIEGRASSVPAGWLSAGSRAMSGCSR